MSQVAIMFMVYSFHHKALLLDFKLLPVCNTLSLNKFCVTQKLTEHAAQFHTSLNYIITDRRGSFTYGFPSVTLLIIANAVLLSKNLRHVT